MSSQTTVAAGSRTSVRSLLAVGLLLLVLAATSFGFSFVDLGSFGLPTALVIAALKALLVLFVFMEFGRLSASARLAASAALFMLFLLVGLMAVDVRFRDPPVVPAPLPSRLE